MSIADSTDTAGPLAVRIRQAVLTVVTLPALPLLLLHAYLLAWFAPYATPAGTTRPPDLTPAPEHAVALWWTLLAALAGAAGSLVLGWLRLRRPDVRWWLLPATVLACLGAAALAGGPLR
ncbi:hypothetical protein AB0K04_28680 [Micromonospora coxensis]|uniref:hypothetical protein n=1 Tax=Micromonospora coxensis TaxID=356852 RepID=UPI0034330C09